MFKFAASKVNSLGGDTWKKMDVKKV